MLRSRVEMAQEIALKFLGKPYIWAGDDPSGFDCSGFVIEILKSTGDLPSYGDWTAEGLRQLLKHAHTGSLREGYLVFWPKENGIEARHVEMIYAVIDGEVFTVGASGGGSKTDTVQDAIDQNAYIKIRPLKSGYFFVVDPF